MEKTLEQKYIEILEENKALRQQIEMLREYASISKPVIEVPPYGGVWEWKPVNTNSGNSITITECTLGTKCACGVSNNYE